MLQYQGLIRHIFDHGWDEPNDRTGVGRRRSPTAPKLVFDLSDGFPLLTTKRVPLRWVAEELFWFLSGDTNEKSLRSRGIDIWKEWADEEHTRKFGREIGDLGPIYGYLWRSFGGDYPNHNGVDQISRLLEEIESSPSSTRLIVTGWDPRETQNVELPPCHTLFQFYVERGETLHCQLFQRSADVFLGVPFNIASYALLTHMVAKVSGLEPGLYIHSFGDAHLYLNHLEQAETILSREPRPLPALELSQPDPTMTKLEQLLSIGWEDVALSGYDPHPTIRAPIAV